MRSGLLCQLKALASFCVSIIYITGGLTPCNFLLEEVHLTACRSIAGANITQKQFAELTFKCVLL